MFNKLKSNLNLDNATNQTARTYWERRINALRWKMSFFFVALNVIGLELSAPGFSLTTTVFEEVGKSSSFLMELINNFQHINDRLNLFDIDINAFGGKSTKLIFISIMAYVVYYLICNKDPFSNLELLREAPYRKISKLEFYFKEIVFYARHLPSNVVAEKCLKCRDGEGCARKLPIEGESKNRTWDKLFALLRPKEVVFWHVATHDCRKAYYLKYGFLFSTIFLVGIQILILVLNTNTYITPAGSLYLTIYICFILIGYLLVSWANGMKTGQGGAYRNFREQSNIYLESEDFDEFLKNHHCNQITSEDEIKHIRVLFRFLDFLIQDKLMRHCVGGSDSGSSNKANIRRILQHISALYYVLYNKEINFRAALFLISDDQRYLYPFILDNSNSAKFYHLEDEKQVHVISSKFFSVNKKHSVVAEAWRKRSPVSRNKEIKPVQGATSDHLKGIHCYPLTFNNDIFDILSERNIAFPNTFGVICVDCDDEVVFSTKQHKLNTLLIRAFAERIIYEISLGLYDEMEEKNA